MVDIKFIAVAILALALASVSYWWWRRRKKQRTLALSQYTQIHKKLKRYRYIKLDHSIASFNAKSSLYEDQSEAWQEAMAKVGKKFKSNQISHVYFIHGTFVGDDPFYILPTIEKLFPRLNSRVLDTLRARFKKSSDQLQRDVGNYLLEYVELFQRSLSQDIKSHLFVWSSGNHHLARLKGALDLIRRINEDLPDIPLSRCLIWGHSHAGQVLAIFSHLVAKSPLGEKLWQFSVDNALVEASEYSKLRKLSKHSFDFVTFGSPIRYPWRLTDKMRLMNCVNHRGITPFAHFPFGFWKTQGGDYVHQWGGIGSDLPSPSSTERQMNKDLDKLLGLGSDLRTWWRHLAEAQRVSPFGKNYLIDYEDQSILVANGFSTIFGHGNYTRFEHMLFHAQLCVRSFYTKKPKSQQVQERIHRIKQWLASLIRREKKSGGQLELP